MDALRQTVFTLAAVAASLSVVSGSAADGWRFGGRSDGEANAALFSNNALTTGSRAIDFHPILTISCKADRDPVWRQSVRVRDPVSGSDGVDVTVRIDNGGDRPERWSLGQKNRALVYDGAGGVARLAGARLMRITWRIGLFSGDGEAVFSLAGAADAIAALATKCGVTPPLR